MAMGQTQDAMSFDEQNASASAEMVQVGDTVSVSAEKKLREEENVPINSTSISSFHPFARGRAPF